ncbi:MAG: metallophosphoesterase family protein [Paracoccaceae bacterium]
MQDLIDLGSMSGDVLAFGGVVSNAHALAALAALASERGIGAGSMVCTGDVVAYCGQPAEAVAGLRALGAATIRGNCEDALARRAGDCGCGFAPGSPCDGYAAAWYAHADACLDDAGRDWMASLPRLATFRAHGRRWGVVHGGVTATSRFLWPTSPETEFAEEIAALEADAGPVDAVLAGHCGLPFARRVAGRLWFNTGALGMPPNDGDRRTSYGVIGADGPCIERLDYDHAGAAEAMRAAGLTQGYDRALASGWWPSEEVLPADLRRAA